MRQPFSYELKGDILAHIVQGFCLITAPFNSWVVLTNGMFQLTILFSLANINRQEEEN